MAYRIFKPINTNLLIFNEFKLCRLYIWGEGQLLQINNNDNINFLYLTQSPHVKKRQHVNMLLGFRHKILQVYITQFRVCNQMYVSSVRIPVNLRQLAGTVPAVRLVNEIPPGFNIFCLCRRDGILLILLFLLLSAWSETRKGQNQL